MNEVFIYDITNEKINEFKVGSFLRNEYISSITDENRKKQSYFVWKVLEKQLTILGVNINDNFVNNNGKWSEMSVLITFKSFTLTLSLTNI